MLPRIQMLTLVLLATTAANGETRRVPSEYPTIQAGINAALIGDTVLVADGTYTGPGNTGVWFNGKAITVRSENGPASCIIDCQGAGSGFLFSGEPPESVLDGFTITNGMALEGGGIYMYYNSNPTILNSIIKGNTANGGEGGGGIYCALANPTIINCTITGNTATVFNGGGGGVYCLMSNPTIRHCVIAGNTTNGLGGGVFSAETSNPTISHSILWGNGPEEIEVDGFSAITVTYSDVQGGWAGIGNADADPRFVDPTNNDYHVLSDSPCIDAGDPNFVAPLGETDMDGDPRIIGPLVDIGADEFLRFGDLDFNGLVDLADFIIFHGCLGGPDQQVPPNNSCDVADFNGDLHVDLYDFLGLQAALAEPQ